MISLLSKLPVKEQLREVHTKAKHDLGEDTSSTSSRLDSDMIRSSTSSTKYNAIKSCAALPWLCVKDNFQDHLMDVWLTAQSAVPFRMFARPSGRTIDLTLQKTTTYNLASFYNDYTEHSKTKILRRNNKKQSHLMHHRQTKRSTNHRTPDCRIRITIGSNRLLLRHEVVWVLKVPQAEKRHTDILRLQNLRFVKNGKVLHHDSALLHLADLVAVTFEMQKKDKKSDTVHHKATKDANMCPVRAAAAIVRRIRNYKDSNEDTPISVSVRGWIIIRWWFHSQHSWYLFSFAYIYIYLLVSRLRRHDCAEASRFKVYFGDWRLWEGVRGSVPGANILSGSFECLRF